MGKRPRPIGQECALASTRITSNHDWLMHGGTHDLIESGKILFSSNIQPLAGCTVGLVTPLHKVELIRNFVFGVGTFDQLP